MRLGLIGFGNIAQTLLAQLAATLEPPLEHICILCRSGSQDRVREHLNEEPKAAALEFSVVSDAAALLAHRPDLVVEAAGHDAVSAHVSTILRAGIDVVLVSIGSLADPKTDKELREAAIAGGSRLILPAGAIGGIDLLSAISAAGGLEVTYRGSKPPAAWAGTPAEKTLDLHRLDKATVFFKGDAREAARSYPKNANVAATLAIAGAGFERTQVELVADPQAPGNVHEYSVVSPLAKYSMRIENLPSAGNAKTSVSTVFSVLREIRNRIGPVAI